VGFLAEEGQLKGLAERTGRQQEAQGTCYHCHPVAHRPDGRSLLKDGVWFPAKR
jgi:hypothetical protein